MPKLEGEPVVRFHCMLFESDLESLRIRFADSVGIGPAIRIIVRNYLKHLEARHPLAEEISNAD